MITTIKIGSSGNQMHLCRAGHINGHDSVTAQYGAHRPMQHDQGFTGNHWTPPSGNYSLRIVPEAARTTINTMMMQHVPTLLAILMAIAVWWYYTMHIVPWKRFVAFIKATKRHHWAITRSDRHQWDTHTYTLGVYFIVKFLKKGSSCPNNNRGATYQTDEEKHL